MNGFPASRLPIYHGAVDWAQLHRDYPVPDVFAETVLQVAGRAGPRIAERTLPRLRRTRLEQPFLPQALAGGRAGAGRRREHRRQPQDPDLQFRRREAGPAREPALRRVPRCRPGGACNGASEDADLGRHHGQAAGNALPAAGMGAQRAHRGAHAIHARRPARRRNANPGDARSRQSRLVRLQGGARLSRHPSADHRHRRGDAEPAADGDRLRLRHQSLVLVPGIHAAAGPGEPGRARPRFPRARHQVRADLPRTRHQGRAPRRDGGCAGLRRLRQLRHQRDGRRRIRMPPQERPPLLRGLHVFRDRRYRDRGARCRTAKAATWW